MVLRAGPKPGKRRRVGQMGADTLAVKIQDERKPNAEKPAKYIPARTPPGQTRSASPVSVPGLGRKMCYWTKKATAENSIRAVASRNVECENAVEHWKAGAPA